MIGFYNYTVWLTYLSLISGTTGIALAFAVPDKPILAIICLLFCGFCDMFDGKIARTKKDRTEQEKNFGIQIDSLSDLICFGVLPASILMSLSIEYFGDLRCLWFLPLAAMFVLFGLIRLAYFNVLEIERQQKETELTNSYFWGVPITMSSIVLPCAYFLGGVLCFDGSSYEALSSLIAYATMMFVLGIMFVIRVKFPKFKKKGTIVLCLVGLLLLVAILILELKR